MLEKIEAGHKIRKLYFYKLAYFYLFNLNYVREKNY